MITEDMAQLVGQSLDRVFALLQAGELSELGGALSELEDRLAAPPQSGAPASAAALDRLRHQAERNAACLKGTARGLRAAGRRIAEVRQAATGLGAYDARGHRVEPALAAARVNRRL